MLPLNERLKIWLENLNIHDLDLKKLEIAFTHSSVKGLGREVEDYERLEFLGDAVLGLIVSERLFKDTQWNEDIMTKLKSRLVKTKPLSDIFDLIDMKPFVRYVGTDLEDSMKEAIMEAFFGVLYLEKGYTKCQEVWNLIMERTGYEQKIIEEFFGEKDINLEGLTPEQREIYQKLQDYYMIVRLNMKQNAINILQDLSQKQWRSEGFRPEYELLNQRGPPNLPTFEYKVRVNLTFNALISFDSSFKILENIKFIEGYGKSSKKKEAKMKAAQDACDNLFISYLEN